MRNIPKGFTLIELMIAVAIVGILAALAIPAYQEYMVRSQVTEGLNLASSVKAGIAEFFAHNASWPASLSTLGYTTDPSGKYASDLQITTGTIRITYGGQSNPNISGSILALTPRVSPNGDVVWLCGYNSGASITPALADPTSGASGSVTTTVTVKYLPQSCRS